MTPTSDCRRGKRCGTPTSGSSGELCAVRCCPHFWKFLCMSDAVLLSRAQVGSCCRLLCCSVSWKTLPACLAQQCRHRRHAGPHSLPKHYCLQPVANPHREQQQQDYPASSFVLLTLHHACGQEGSHSLSTYTTHCMLAGLLCSWLVR